VAVHLDQVVVLEVRGLRPVDDPSVVVEYLHSFTRVSLQRTHDCLRRIRELSRAGGIVFT
jgi:hypothetical protein